MPTARSPSTRICETCGTTWRCSSARSSIAEARLSEDLEMDRRAFLHATGLGIVAASADILAQPAGPLPRIGLLTPGPNPREPGFWRGMHELGYTEGKTIVVDRRSAEGNFSRLPVLAKELVANRPDVIVAIASASTNAAKYATTSIPIVMVGVTDPIAEGFVADLAHPGG